MGENKKINNEKLGPFDEHSEEIIIAYKRAVRDALLRHKLAGNPVAVSRDGKVVVLQPDEILKDEG